MSKVIKQILSRRLSGRCAKIPKPSEIIVFSCEILLYADSYSYASFESAIDVAA